MPVSSADLDFWYEFGSTYSYPAAMRMQEAADEAGVRVRWRAFLLGPIFREQGWNDSPFNIYAAKGRYMWRDLERLCEGYGLPWRRPSVFPRNGLLAARVAVAAEAERWLPDFATGIYLANFARDEEIAEPGVVAAVLEGLGQDPGRWLGLADTPRIKEALREQTAEAVRIGIFGAPSFVVGDELFWGDDRLEQALARAAR
jgi:2-hydroxychromene-2-carboxylate isomerase